MRASAASSARARCAPHPRAPPIPRRASQVLVAAEAEEPKGVVRLLKGTVGTAASLEEESHSSLLLEHPHYTRPANFRGQEVPEVLRSGDHGAIARWRAEQQKKRTRERRPDLFARWLEQDLDPARLQQSQP